MILKKFHSRANFHYHFHNKIFKEKIFAETSRQKLEKKSRSSESEHRGRGRRGVGVEGEAILNFVDTQDDDDYVQGYHRVSFKTKPSEFGLFETQI